MSSEELLARLSRLDAHDRAWLLGELPAAMRRELATLLSDEPERAAPALARDPERLGGIGHAAARHGIRSGARLAGQRGDARHRAALAGSPVARHGFASPA